MTRALILVTAMTLAALPAAVTAQDDQLAAAATELAQADPQANEGPIDENLPLDPTDLIVSAEGVSLSDFHWVKRLVVVLADSPADPRYVQQMQFLMDRPDALADRDVIIITDTDPGARTAVRRELRPRGFMLTVISKDGTIITRKPSPWDVREITRSIDKQPLRQQEVRDRRDTLRE